MKENDPKTICQKYISSVIMHTYEFIIYYAEQLNENTVEFLHHHPYYEIYYVISGSLNICVDDHTLHMLPGEVLFLTTDIKHHVIYEPDSKRSYFVIIFNVLNLSNTKPQPDEYDQEREEIFQKFSMINKNKYIIESNYFYGNEILDDIRNEMNQRCIGWNTLVNSFYFHFFINAIRCIGSNHSFSHEPPQHLNLALEASKYIHENYQKDITLESVSKYLNITPRHVNRVFKNLFGTTFSRTLSLLRVNYAKKYLNNSGYSIERISELVGFASSRTLYRLFKEIEGIPISQYRVKYKMKI